MVARSFLALSVVALILGALPGCCCCVPGFGGRVPQPQPFPQPQPQPMPQPFPQDGVAVGPGPDKKADDRKQDDRKIDEFKRDNNQAPDKKAGGGKAMDKKDGPPVKQPALDDVATGGPLVADPLRKPLAPVKDARGSIELPREEPGALSNDPIRYPWVTSPIFAVASSDQGPARWQVWDMQAMKQLGTVPGGSGSTVYVSPDGEYLGIEVRKPMSIETAGTQIYRVADGQALKLLPTRFATDSTIGVTDFAGPGQMYSVQSAAFKKARVKVWDVKTAEQLASFETPSCLDHPYVVTSPGGRYLAMVDPHGTSAIYIYELPGGKEVRTIQIRLPQASYTRCLGLMFSDDGKELASLFEIGGTSSRIRVWDVASGKRTVDHSITPPLEKTAKNVGFYRTPLLWLPDGSGWFVFGQLMVDKVRGKVFWTMPPQDPVIPWPRRFVDADHVVTVMGKAPQRRFEIVTLPRDQIEAARKK
jgi:hypothetical protein